MQNEKFALYFAGTGSPILRDLIRELSCDQLLSQLNERREVMGWVDYLRSHPECTSKLFVDSGAYSAYTKGKEIDVEDYINLINNIGDVVTVFAQVDKIPQVIGREPTPEEFSAAAHQSWDNYLYMISKVDKKYRDKIMPVFHFQEDTKWLKQMLEYTHEDGSHIKYIGLAVSTVDNADVRSRWLDMCFKIIKTSSNPDVMTHAFGTTAWDVLEQFPLTSSDSTTWILSAVNGAIIVNKKAVTISDRTKTKNAHLLHKSPAVYEEVEKKANQFGFTIEQLMEDYISRLKFNVYSIKEWQENYKCRYNCRGKQQLF